MATVLDGHDVVIEQPETSQGSKGRKLHISLRAAEIEAVRAEARQEGMTLAGWVAALIRARLRARPVFSRAELEALSEACLQLSAVGRNLNTAVHRLHKEGRWYEQGVELAALGEAVRLVTTHMNAVVEVAGERGKF